MSENHNRESAGAKVAKFIFCLIPFIHFSGCGYFFSEKFVDIQSERIRKDIATISPVADTNVYETHIYKTPPEIVQQEVGGKIEWKLFYFCKYHKADAMSKMVLEQFATKIFDKKGKDEKIPDYTVSTIPATNQLIVRCPNEADVKAVLEAIERVDVPPIQVKIDCLISEVYADQTLDWETTLEISNLFGEDISAGGSAKLFGTDVLDLIQETQPLPAFPGASLREVARAKMGLKVGYAGEDFLAVVDILESRGYLKILMNPSLEVVNGQKAKISSSEHVPLEKIFLHDREGFVETKTEYVDVVDSLEIVPHVYADGYIGLETTAIISSKNIPEGVKQIRIVTKREIFNQENRIRQGESLVIGGIRKSEEGAVVRGVPFLKDIPLLGILFSSKDYEERATETMFILTPTISSAGLPNREMVEKLRLKHEDIKSPEGIEKTIMDPLGFEIRQQEHEFLMQNLRAEYADIADAKERTRRQIREAQLDAEFAQIQAEKQIKEAEKKIQEAVRQKEKATAEIQKLKADLEKAKVEAQKARQDIENAKSDPNKAESQSTDSGKQVGPIKEETETPAEKKEVDDAAPVGAKTERFRIDWCLKC